MNLYVARHSDAAGFLAAAESWLLAREAHNSLILGVALAQRRQAQTRRRRLPIYLTVSDATGLLLAAVSTAGIRLLLAGDDTTDDDALDALVEQLPRSMPEVFAEQKLARRFAARWSAARWSAARWPATTGPPATIGERQHLLQVTGVTLTAVTLLPHLPAGRLRPATVREAELLGDWLFAFQTTITSDDTVDREAASMIVNGLLARKDIYVWAVGEGAPERPVSMAIRSRPTANGTAISYVYTPAAERRHGYATACVVHLSQSLLDDGWQFCTLFVEDGHTTARNIYHRLGYQPIAEFAGYRLMPAPAP